MKLQDRKIVLHVEVITKCWECGRELERDLDYYGDSEIIISSKACPDCQQEAEDKAYDAGHDEGWTEGYKDAAADAAEGKLDREVING